MFKSLLLAGAAVLALSGVARAEVNEVVGVRSCETLYVIDPDGLQVVTNECTPSPDDPTIGTREIAEYVGSRKECADRVLEITGADPDSHPGCKIIAGVPFKDLRSPAVRK